MRIINKNTLVLLLTSSLVLSCAVPNNTVQKAPDNNTINQNIEQGTVKFRLDFPAKFTTNAQIKGFAIKALELGKINRVKIRVNSATTDFTIERNVDLVPGGIEATLSLPLDKLYTVTVQGMNDTNPVSGAEIKGYFSLMSSSITPVVDVNQNTTPIAKIIEGLKIEFAKIKADVTSNDTSIDSTTTATAGGTTEVTSNTTTTTDTNTTDTTNTSTTPTPAPKDSSTTTISTPENTFKLKDIDLTALVDVVQRGRINAHPSFVNVKSYVDEIMKLKAVPFEVPANPLLKPGKLKGSISGLKANETAIITVGDPASKQTIVVTPPIVSKSEDTTSDIDPDSVSASINFEIDNITPGEWETKVFASGYSQKSSSEKITVGEGAEASSSFSVEASKWLITPKNISGSVGNSDQSNLFKDEIDNIHVVWRQDGFDTDTNSGIIQYSRWNGTSWTTQAVNVSQYNNSGLRGSRDPDVSVGLDRLPQVIWSSKDSSGNRKVYFNKFNGTTWQTPQAISGSDNGINTSITVDKTNGYAYAVWESDGSIYLSQYDRTNWNTPINMGTGTLPKIDMGSDNIAHVVWKSSNSQKLLYSNWTQAKGASQIEVLPMNVLGNDILNSIDTSVDRFNRLHVVWRNDTYVQYTLRSNVSWQQPEIVNRIETKPIMSAKSGASVSVAPTGIVNVAWVSIDSNNKEVIRFRRRLSDGWKTPFSRINDPTEPIKIEDKTTTTTTTDKITEILKSENIDGYEDIPLSGVSSTIGKPLINADGLGNIHVIWSNKGRNSDDTDLLHSTKTIETSTK